MLQLQPLNEDETIGLGELYINVEHISAIYFREGKTRGLCVLLLSNGKEFITVQPIFEVLDKIAALNKRKSQFGP
jgi:uncharacterized protein YlzI (FlbEa/FlbD family)